MLPRLSKLPKVTSWEMAELAGAGAQGPVTPESGLSTPLTAWMPSPWLCCLQGGDGPPCTLRAHSRSWAGVPAKPLLPHEGRQSPCSGQQRTERNALGIWYFLFPKLFGVVIVRERVELY